MYIDENHYKKNRTSILNSFSIIKYGALGKKEYDFKPEHIFEILPIILNKMIIGIFNGKSMISTAFIRCYFHYVLLFKKLCLEFEEDYCKYVNHILTLVKKNNYEVNRQIIPDLGNFLMLLFFSNRDTHTDKMKKIWYALFEESAARRPNWIFHGDVLKEITRELVLKFQKPTIDEVCIKRFELDEDYNMIHQKLFMIDLKNEDLYNKIIEIMKTDTNINDMIYDNYEMLQFEHDFDEDFETYFNEKKPKYIQEIFEDNFKRIYTNL